MSQFLSSNELFINIKDAPKWNPKKNYFDQSVDVLDFYLEERRKLTEGVTIGGYFIHPWLYWHINFFKTPIPTKDKQEKIMNPPLDDNILYMIENYQEAEQTNKGLCMFGTRGFSKSTMISSLTTWLNTSKPNGTTSIIGGDKGDLAAISKLLGVGFNNVNPALFIPQLITDWEKEVEFGLREKDGFRLPHSHVSITNAEKGTGKSSEKGAGLSPVGFIMDEALHEDSLLHTLEGTIPIKDIKVGDYIFGGDGKLTKVIDKINPGIVDLYKFTLSDGREVISSDNHVWKVYNTNKNKWVEITTEDIRSKYFYNKTDSRSGKITKSLLYSLPVNGPIEHSKKELTIDPYWLGLYLGDGFSSSTTICSIDDEIIEYCEKHATSLGMSTTISTIPREGLNLKFRNIKTISSSNRRNNKLLDKLRSLDILNNKHIPEEYFYASFDQRLELLQGLLDTDGSCSKLGTIEFSTSAVAIKEGFCRLLRSLGINFRIIEGVGTYRSVTGEKIECKVKYRFNIFTDLDVFKLGRKRENYKISEGNNNSKKQQAYKTRTPIKLIEYVGKGQAYCIKVDNVDNLFLTEDHIVTHNCGKYDFKAILTGALPSFTTQYGAKLVHILSGTSGNTELTKDAKEVLSDPAAFNLIMMNWDRLDKSVPEEAITWGRSKKEKFSVFVPAQMSYRLEVPKIKTNLADHLKINNESLKLVDINVTNWVEASKHIQDKNASFKKEADREKNRMYYPLEIADVFITSASNPFPTAVIDKHIRELEDAGTIGKDVNLYKSGSETKSEFSNKKRAAVSHGGGEADAPVILFGELPSTPPPKYTFVSGLDDYKLDLSDTDSVGAFFVLKRRNLSPDTPCETIAASYSGRPFRHAEFHNTCETMLDAWSAVCCMEAVDVSFKQHLDAKRKSEQCLAPGISFSQTSQNNGGYSGNTKFGIYPTGGNKTYMFNLLVDAMKEEYVIGIDDLGNEIVKYGVEYIDDIDLLKEMLSYKKGGNYDRITAFMHALTYARELDKNSVRPKEEKKQNFSAQQSSVKTKISIYGNKRPNAF